MPRDRSSRTDRAREAFLQRLAETCNVSESARVAGIPRRTVYEWRDADPSFAAAWKDAEEQAADLLEMEAWKRATTDKSDRMLEILLKAHRPDKFTERLKNEHSGAVTINVASEDAEL
jgi:hypothetical protein